MKLPDSRASSYGNHVSNNRHPTLLPNYRTERGPGSPAGQPRWGGGCAGSYRELATIGSTPLEVKVASGATALGSVVRADNETNLSDRA